MSAMALGLFALALLVDAGSPGPTVAALISRVLTHGFRDVVPFLAAIWIGEALWLTVTVAGLAVVARTFATTFLVLRYAGIAYLMILAWRMWQGSTAPAAGSLPDRQRPWRMFAAGLLVSIGNPKNAVFYLALLPSVIDLDRVTVAGWGELVSTMLLVLAGIDLAWCAAAVRARRWLRQRRTIRLTNRIGASMMAAAAVAIAVR